MNREKFDMLINNYIDRYETINREHDEIDKWMAVLKAYNTWELEAEDFSAMLKETMGNTVILDNGHVQPVSGLVALCKLSTGIQEEVRSEFRKLFSSDGGDIKARQQKTMTFVDNINKLLAREFPGKWRYEQHIRNAIGYLTLISPEDNYFYKHKEAKAYADCIEFGDDIGTGQDFRLDHYYRMCDELVMEIQDNEELIKLLDGLLIEAAENDTIINMHGKLNILAYYIIYCSDSYNLYDNIPVIKKSKTATEKKHAEKQQQIEVLKEKKSGYAVELQKILDELDAMDLPDLCNEQVSCNKYGTGKVIKQGECNITIQFSNEEKKFKLPDAVVSGFLKLENKQYVDTCFKIAGLLEQKKDIEGIIKEIDRKLSFQYFT